jgi:hypothetical protein
MKLLVLFTVALGALSITSQASDAEVQPAQYLCVANKKTGFVYNLRLHDWDAATFQAGDKYIISVRQPLGGPFEITAVGESSPSAYCEKGFDDWGSLYCFSSLGEFTFNKYNKRFIHSQTGGRYYVARLDEQEPDEGSPGPYLEIGKCSGF